MSEHFVLLIHEPEVASQRAVQVNGLPFTIGNSDDANVRLRTPNVPFVRVEEAEEAGQDFECLNLDTGAVTALRHGDTFHLDDVTVRFFVGTVESLKRSATPKIPASGSSAERVAAYLDRLAGLEQRLQTQTWTASALSGVKPA